MTPDPEPPSAARGRDVIPLSEATRTWFAISLQTFGGPAGQIAVMQHHLVDEKRWIGQRGSSTLSATACCCPGPEAQQLAIYTGWLLNGTRGGLIAGGLFVLPGLLALLVLSAVYVAYGSTAFVTAVFAGLAPAVIAIVVQAVYRVGRRSLTHPALVALAVAAFVALTLLRTPFPIVILAAGAFGWLAGRRFPGLLRLPPEDLSDGPAPLIGDDALHHERPSRRRSVLILVVGLAIWAAPVVVVALAVSSTTVFADQALFFSGAAVVTFGGAYAVLAYVAQQAVQVYGWLTAGEMVSGLALAETTPGPLIMVVQFVAFLGAYHDPGALNPWVAAVLGVAAGQLGDVRAVLPVRAARGALRRAAAAQHAPRRGADRHHRGRGRASSPTWRPSSPSTPCSTRPDTSAPASSSSTYPSSAPRIPSRSSSPPWRSSSCSGEAGARFARSGCAPCWASPPRCRSSCDLRQVAPTAATSGSSCGLSMSAGQHRRRLGVPADPRARRSWSIARTVSSRIPVRDARSSISSTQVAGLRVAVAPTELAQRVEDVDVEPDVGVGQAVGARPRVEEHGEGPVDVARGLGQQGQPAGRDPLPAGVADLAGPRERLLEACGRRRRGRPSESQACPSSACGQGRNESQWSRSARSPAARQELGRPRRGRRAAG